MKKDFNDIIKLFKDISSKGYVKAINNNPYNSCGLTFEYLLNINPNSSIFPDYKDIEIKFTGLRPGEKLYEEVLSDKENTIPTENKKIMIAKVRHYADILDTYAEFEKLSRTVKIMDTVRLMKKVVPEFKSKNSPRFEVLDK